MNITDDTLHRAIVDSILNIYHTTIRNVRNPNRHTNFTISRYSSNSDSEHNYIIPDNDDISSAVLLDIITQFGSPGSVSSLDSKNFKKLGKYKKVKESDICGTNCPICLDEFKESEYYRNLNCNHSFHKKCIDRWLKKENNCPMCRANAF